MRNLKKFLALVLATLMVISAAATVSAYSDVADDDTYAAAIAALTEYGIVNGTNTELDTFSPDDDVVRYQMALMMARALEPKTTDWQNGMAIFEDVTEWYGAIAYAYMNGIVTGMDATHFEPKTGIKCRDALIMAVRALGYEVDVTLTPYWIGAYQTAAKIGLTKNLQVNDPAKTLTRAETAQVIYNMLKATPADGGATIEAKNFGASTDKNTTTFVLTATENQAYMKNAVSEKGTVGIQELVNGIPAGDIVYVPAEVLGIDADKVDDYFGYAFDLVNFNAATKKFDRAIPGKTPVVAYNADVSVNNGKITINGVPYVAADSITGAALRNELVIFNGGKLANAAKMLLLNKDGNIVDYNGAVKATFAYETASGAKYYVYQPVGQPGTTVISEAKALELFGVPVDNDSYIEYQTLEAKDLTGNYQITLFDDDRDDKFERAIVTDVYLSDFTPKNSNGYEQFGPMKTAGAKNSTYTVALTKGQLFTYTYNEQTNVVTVLDVLEAQTGTLTRINTTEYTKDGKWATVLTIDGKQYTLGNAKREAKGLTSATIYDKYVNDEINYKNAFDKTADGNKVNYYYDAVSGVASGLTVGSPIKFYALENGTIITAKSYKIDDVFDRVVLKEINSYDNDNVYVDMYLNGKLLEDVAVSKIDGKTLSELTIFQLSRLLGNEKLFAYGNVFRAVKLTDGSYQLSEYLVLKDNPDTTKVDEKAASLKAFKLVQAKFGTKVTFSDGIADIYNDNGFISGDRAIRTNDSTVFYFLKKNGNEISSIYTYVGKPDKSSIDFSDSTIEMYTDKYGYTGDNKGVSSIVLVYYTNSESIKGFGVPNVESNIAYIFGSGALTAYNSASAAELGLTGSEYVGKYFYEYNVTAINMANGAKITKIYSDKDLNAGQFVSISTDGVVIKTNLGVNDGILEADLNTSDFAQNRYYKISGIANGTGSDSVKITTVKLTKSSGYDVKTDDVGKVLTSIDTKVKYINDFEDGSFVGVAFGVSDPDEQGKVTIKTNAQYTTTDGMVYAAQFANVKVTDKGAVVGTLTVSKNKFDKWDKNETSKVFAFSSSDSFNIKKITLNGKEITNVELDFDIKDNGTVEFTFSNAQTITNRDIALAAGTYVVEIVNSINAVATITFTK